MELAKNVSSPAMPRVSSTALNVSLDTHRRGFCTGRCHRQLRSRSDRAVGQSGSGRRRSSISTRRGPPRAVSASRGPRPGRRRHGTREGSVVAAADGGIAATFDVRLPTGDEDNLRGLGITRTTAALVWSKGGRVSPHANFGFEFWSKEVPISASGDVSIRHQLKYAAGVEIDAHPQLTVLLDFVGRQLRGGGQLAYQTFGNSTIGTVDALVGQAEGINSFWIVRGRSGTCGAASSSPPTCSHPSPTMGCAPNSCLSAGLTGRSRNPRPPPMGR